MLILSLALSLFCAAPQAEERLSKAAAELGSSDPAVRERAAKEIVSLGRPALAALKTLESGATDPEIRLRAAAIAREILEDLRRSALKIEVATDKPKYEPGGRVTVTVRLKNVEDFPVTVYLGDGEVRSSAHAEILSGGKRVPIVVPSKQIMVLEPIAVDEKEFRTIAPGKSVDVYTLIFSQRWDLKDKDPSFKASYADAKTPPLDAGTYRARATFAWGHKTKKEKEEAVARAPGAGIFTFEYKFTPRAEKLISEAWEGALEGGVDFQVAKD